MQIVYSKAAAKTLTQMPANTARLIRAKIESCATDPASLANNVKRLKAGSGEMRLRIGDWRVIFREEGMVLAIIRIAPRSRAYD